MPRRPPASPRPAITDMRQARAVDRQRERLLARVEHALDTPMAVLGFVWLALLVIDFVRGLSPGLQTLSNFIWALFVVNFVLEIIVAPHKGRYLRRNWLTALSLLVPALRMFRILRIARAMRAVRVARGLRMLRLISTINRGLGALGTHMSRRGFVYVVALTLLVTLAGSAGMYAFERDAPGGGLLDFSSALWWTAMIMATMGSDYWPVTAEGRLLCWLLAIYAFAVFGYVTAALASFFIGRDAQLPGAEIAGGAQIERLSREVALLRRELEKVLQQRTAPVSAGDMPSRREEH